MLAPTPYQVSSREGKERSGEAQSGLQTRGTSRTVSGEIGTPMLDGERGGESIIPSPNEKKRAAPEDLKAEASKRGKMSLSGSSGSEDDIVAQFLRKDKPLAES